MTRDEEIILIKQFLEHPAGFDIDISGLLCIRPIDENSPPSAWEVDWTEDFYATVSPACPYEFGKEFLSLQEAVEFFVTKRHELRIGLDW